MGIGHTVVRSVPYRNAVDVLTSRNQILPCTGFRNPVPRRAGVVERFGLTPQCRVRRRKPVIAGSDLIVVERHGIGGSPVGRRRTLAEIPPQRRISGIHRRAVLRLEKRIGRSFRFLAPVERVLTPPLVIHAVSVRAACGRTYGAQVAVHEDRPVPVGHRLRSVGHPDMPAPDDPAVLHQRDQRIALAFADREGDVTGHLVEGDPRNKSFGIGPQPVGRHVIRQFDRRLETDSFAGAVSAHPGIENVTPGSRNHIAVGRPRSAQVIDLRRRKRPAVRQRDFHPAVFSLYRPEQLHALVTGGLDRISGGVPDLPRRHGGVRRHDPEALVIASHDGNRSRDGHLFAGSVFQPRCILFRGERPVIRVPVGRNADQRRFRSLRTAGYRHFGPVAEREPYALFGLGQRPHFRLRHGSGQRFQRDQTRIQVLDLLQQFGRRRGNGFVSVRVRGPGFALAAAEKQRPGADHK